MTERIRPLAIPSAASRPPRKTGGFTLIEMLVVIAVILILASTAIVRTGGVKSKAAVSGMQNDLRNLATAQEAYFSLNGQYTTDIAALGMKTTPGVTLDIKADADGWSALATSDMAEGRECALFLGDIAPQAPASHPGALECKLSSGSSFTCS